MAVETPEQIAARKARDTLILGLRKRGWSYQQIGDAAGCPASTAAGVIKRAKKPKKEPLVKKWSEYQDAKLREMAADGATFGEIARHVARSISGVAARAQLLGIKICPRERDAAPEHLPSYVAARNYEAIAARLEAGLRRANVAVKPDPRRAPQPGAVEPLREASS